MFESLVSQRPPPQGQWIDGGGGSSSALDLRGQSLIQWPVRRQRKQLPVCIPSSRTRRRHPTSVSFLNDVVMGLELMVIGF